MSPTPIIKQTMAVELLALLRSQRLISINNPLAPRSSRSRGVVRLKFTLKSSHARNIPHTSTRQPSAFFSVVTPQ